VRGCVRYCEVVGGAAHFGGELLIGFAERGPDLLGTFDLARSKQIQEASTEVAVSTRPKTARKDLRIEMELP